MAVPAFALSETSAVSTGELRCARASSQSSSSNRIGPGAGACANPRGTQAGTGTRGRGHGPSSTRAPAGSQAGRSSASGTPAPPARENCTPPRPPPRPGTWTPGWCGSRRSCRAWPPPRSNPGCAPSPSPHGARRCRSASPPCAGWPPATRNHGDFVRRRSVRSGRLLILLVVSLA